MRYAKFATRGTRFAFSALALGVALPWSSLAVAAEADAQASSDDTQADAEIVVTALKSDLSVQKAPVTINTVSGDQLQARSVTSVEQLTMALPGVRIQQSPQGSIATSIRGLASSPATNTFDQTVGLFVDGVYAGHGRDYSSALFDLKRVELLKGTQSAIVGKGTSMGAIALVTNRPEFNFGGSLSVYHELELGTTTVNGVINVPLSENIAARIAVLTSSEGGWMQNALSGDDWPQVKRDGVRLSIRYKPNDAFEWNVYGQYAEQRLNGQHFRYGVDATGAARTFAASRGDPNWVTAPYMVRSSPRSGDANNPSLNYFGFSEPGSRMNAWKFVSNLSYDAGPVTISATTGYSKYDDYNLIDSMGLPQLGRIAAGYDRNKAFSQELRFATNSGGPLSAIAGVHYWHDDWGFTQVTDTNTSASAAANGAFSRNYTQKTRTTNLFGQLVYKPTDSLWLTGGIRYEYYKKSGHFDGVNILRLPAGVTAATSILLAAGNVPFVPFDVTNSKNFLDWSTQAQYFVTENLQLYVSYATASKGFGYQQSPTSGVVGNPTLFQNPYFNPEHAKTIESGFKWAFADLGHLNLAYYRTTLKDYQYSFRLPTTVVIVRNDQIKSEGVELSANLQPLKGLSLSMTGTYSDVKKTVPVAGSIPGMPLAPKWSGMGEIVYTTPLNDNLQLTTGAMFEFRSMQYLNDSATATLRTDPGRVRTDLRIGVEYKPANLEVSLVTHNLFNVHAISYSYASPLGGAIVADEKPREIGVQMRIKF